MAQALCHLEIAHVGCAVEEAAYLAGEKLYDERHKKVHDKREKQWEVLATHILAPAYAPTWVYDLEKLTNSLEKEERQRNAQVLRKMMIVLPKELSHDQNIALTAEYAQTFLQEEGMIVIWAVHDKGEQPHAHLIFPMRPLLPSGTWGAKAQKAYILDSRGEKIRLPSGEYKSYKVRTTNWDDRGNCEKWRQRYQDIANKHLKMAGLSIQLDMKSYERQGLDIMPAERLSRAEYELQKRGVQTVRGERNEQICKTNRRRLSEKLVAVLKALASKREHWSAEQEALYRQKTAEREMISQEILQQATLTTQRAKWEAERHKIEQAQKHEQARQEHRERFMRLLAKKRRLLKYWQERLLKVEQEQLAPLLKQAAAKQEALEKRSLATLAKVKQITAQVAVSSVRVVQQHLEATRKKAEHVVHEVAHNEELADLKKLPKTLKEQIGKAEKTVTSSPIPEAILQRMTDLPSRLAAKFQTHQPPWKLEAELVTTLHHERRERQREPVSHVQHQEQETYHDRPVIEQEAIREQKSAMFEALLQDIQLSIPPSILETSRARQTLQPGAQQAQKVVLRSKHPLTIHGGMRLNNNRQNVRGETPSEKRRLLEVEFANQKRHIMAEEDAWWQKLQPQKNIHELPTHARTVRARQSGWEKGPSP